MSEIETFESVWDALENTPEAAAQMRLRSDLLVALQDSIESWRLSSPVAAERIGLTKVRFENLRQGRISHSVLEELVSLADRANLTIEIRRQAAE